MAEFKLGRIRFVWKGAWASPTTYYKDDVVRFGGKTYICQVGHVSNIDFNVDLQAVPSKWNQMTDGVSFIGNWTVSTAYQLNDIVNYGGTLYICTIAHTSAATAALGLEADSGKWSTFAEGLNWTGDWNTSARYKANDIVKYGATTYVCNTGHTSAATAALGLEADQSKWDIFNRSFDYLGDWTTATRYKVNDVVKNGGGLWICVTYHESTDFISDEANWTQLVEGTEFAGTWNSGTTYQPGDIVAYGGNQYISLTNHLNTLPTAPANTDWDLYLSGFKFTNEWNNSTNYKVGEVVRQGGYTYLCTSDTTNYTVTVSASSAATNLFTTSSTNNWEVGMTIRFTGSVFGDVNAGATYYIESLPSSTEFTITDVAGGLAITPLTASGSMSATVSAEPPNNNYWERLNSGMRWRGIWADDTQYLIGDVVRYTSNTFICVKDHRSEQDDGSTIRELGGGSPLSRPDQDATGTYWNVLTVGNETSVLTTLGDLVYFGGSGPTRLPVGEKGQILRVSDTNVPEWVTLGQTDYVYFVANHGQDLPAPQYGKTIDKPWKTIRYACEQVEKGPRNPQATRLLELNRQFIQREVTNWIDRQIQTNTAPFTSSFDYDEYKCERDTGFIVDALIHDLRRGGNVKSREAALSYVNALGEGYDTGTYNFLSAQSDEDVAGYEYMLEVVEAVLTNTDPAVNYQNLMSNSTAIVEQYKEPLVAVEPGVMETVTGLVTIITDAITAQSADNIPAEIKPNNLIEIKTGRYRETLPIVVPAGTCLLGDEVRSVNAGPAGSVVDITDAKYNLGALNHLASVVGDVIQGTTVTPQSGNSQTQSQEWPYADATQEAATDELLSAARHKIDWALNTQELVSSTDPTNYNTSYLGGYGDARKLINENKRFLQAEIIAWIADNYPDVKYSRTSCRRDVGLIVDALAYDLTYGGSSQSLNAGLSYFNGVGGALTINSLELTATLAAYARLKTLLTEVATNTTVTTSQTDVVQFKDTALTGGSSATSFIQSNLDLMIAAVSSGTPPTSTITNIATNLCTTSANHGLAVGDIIEVVSSTGYGLVAGRKYWVLTTPALNTFTLSTAFSGSTLALTNASGLSITVYKYDNPATAWVGAGLTTAFTTLTGQVTTIQEATIDYINSTFGNFVYNSAKCRRDTAILFDGAYYDVALGTNFNAITNGISYRRGTASEVINGQLTQTLGAIQKAKLLSAASLASNSTAVTRSNAYFDEALNIIENGTSVASAITWSDPGVDNNKRYAREQLQTNRAYIISQMSTWISTNYSSLWTSLNADARAAWLRDIGYIVDALSYDIQYGGNSAARVAAQSYFENGVSILPTSQKAARAASVTQVGVICSQVVTESYGGQDTSGTAASATEATQCTTLAAVIQSVITADNLSGLAALTSPSISWAAAGIQTAVTTLANDVLEGLVTDVLQYISDTYNSFTYNLAKCSRDVQLILNSVGYDFMFNSNFQTVKAGHSYLRQTAEEVFSLGQKSVTRAALEYVRTLAIANVSGDSTAISRINTLMATLDDIIYAGSLEGHNLPTQIRNNDHAILQLERNRNFIVSDVTAYIANTYSDVLIATTATTNLLTISDTSWLQRNTPIRFVGAFGFGGISTTNITYYVQNVVNSTQFTISTVKDATFAQTVALSTDTGSLPLILDYDTDLCERDINAFVDALKYDLKTPGNYKTLTAAQYYVNAVKGSLEENMFLVRDGTGVRNMTLEGLTGDLTSPNAYGTSRVTAGAYVSLDPGWGPDDRSVWITTRSCYVQNVATFGTAAIGQKIDGALHNGGNDSIVSNDFTQLISDGIGAWVTNNGRAELVSVFTYYSHIGYLSENGGRIRGTNGNNSYGDFGAVAEGFDSRETPNTAIVDNRFQYKATVGSVFTDTDDILTFEWDNAGSDYTEATYVITGAGLNANVVQDEFRDGAVFQVRLLDNVDDSTDANVDGNYGGFGYVSNANTAQTGTTSSLTIAATDSETSTAYIGMKLYLTGGSGAGQYGIISAYNSGTKVASVVKESTGAAGWDHAVPGRTIQTPDASTTYVIEPAVSFTAPAFSSTTATLNTSGTWASTVWGATTATYTGLSGTYPGDGEGATFTVIRNGYKYFVSIQTGGTGYTRLETITIPGTSLGGTTPTNDLTLTITSVNSVSGAITAIDQSGYGIGGRYVAIRSGSRVGSYSDDGLTWTNVTTMTPATNTWTATAHALIDDGSSVGKVSRFVAIASGTNAAAYSDDGINWIATTMPSSSNWVDVVYGAGKFVAISSNSTTVAISLDGIVWDIAGGPLSTTGMTSITYGMGYFVTVPTGGDSANISTDGVTWTVRTLPASANWTSVKWGNGRFVAVNSDTNNGAYSVDAINWTAMTMGSLDGSSVSGYQKVAYGQGLFMATAYLSGSQDYSFVATSEDGINWTTRGVPQPAGSFSGYGAVTFGSSQRIGRWIVIGKDSGNHALSIRAGARARARAFVADEKISAIRIVEPGSGYDTAPTITITDPNNVYEAPTSVRIGNGALATPTFINRGANYISADAAVDTGDGYGDFFQSGQFIAVRQITERPVAGSNVVFGHLPNRTFKLVNVLTFVGSLDGSYTAFFQVSPEMSIYDAPPDGTTVTTRIRYSQVRLTGHDFLDIGTGNFEETNYPGVPTQTPIQANETVESNGGRVFFTSTDQDGNFRVGDLFTIEQSTGIATLNADAFNIAGLQELTLGEVALGGGSASITEFSTDPFFSADSDSIVPTQRAIKAYIASQIGGGGAALNVNSVTAGFIQIQNDTISTTTGGLINMRAKFNFQGEIRGIPQAWSYYFR